MIIDRERWFDILSLVNEEFIDESDPLNKPRIVEIKSTKVQHGVRKNTKNIVLIAVGACLIAAIILVGIIIANMSKIPPVSTGIQSGFQFSDNAPLPSDFCAYKSETDEFDIDNVTVTFFYGGLFSIDIDHELENGRNIPEFDVYFGDENHEPIYMIAHRNENFVSEKYRCEIIDDENFVKINYNYSEKVTIPKSLLSENSGVIRFCVRGTNINEISPEPRLITCVYINYDIVNGKVVLSPWDGHRTNEYSTKWSYDETDHWHEAKSGAVKDKGAHVFDDKGICTVCGYSKYTTFHFDENSAVSLKYECPDEEKNFDIKLNSEQSKKFIISLNKITYCKVYEEMDFDEAYDCLTIEIDNDTVALFNVVYIVQHGGYFELNWQLCESVESFGFIEQFFDEYLSEVAESVPFEVQYVKSSMGTSGSYQIVKSVSELNNYIAANMKNLTSRETEMLDKILDRYTAEFFEKSFLVAFMQSVGSSAYDFQVDGVYVYGDRLIIDDEIIRPSEADVPSDMAYWFNFVELSSEYASINNVIFY